MVYTNPGEGGGGGSSKRRRGWGLENSPPDCVTADQWECKDTNRVYVVFVSLNPVVFRVAGLLAERV